MSKKFKCVNCGFEHVQTKIKKDENWKFFSESLDLLIVFLIFDF